MAYKSFVELMGDLMESRHRTFVTTWDTFTGTATNFESPMDSEFDCGCVYVLRDDGVGEIIKETELIELRPA